MIRLFYPDLFAEDAHLRQQAESLASRTYELSEFLLSVVGTDDVGATFTGKVAYHASCHLQRELGVTDAPRQLISRVAGIKACDAEMSEQCCGFGGTFAVKYPEISSAMLEKKIASLQRAGADTLVSCDAGCLMHIAGRLRRQGMDVRVMHLAELLNTGHDAEEARHASGN
jgi:L-lactate dehydrogenase complex protein LldE